MLSQTYIRRLSASPTVALGTTDDSGSVWCTIWGGDLPIMQQVARGGVIGVKAAVDAQFDPVVETLYGGRDDGEIIKCEQDKGRMVSGLSILLEERDRVKLFGRMVAGCLDATEVSDPNSSSDEAGAAKDSKPSKIGTAQLVLHITQSLGNCPKYINKKAIKSHPSSRPQLLSDNPHLSPEAIAHVHSADIFFVASRGPEDMDCNHRGGMPGFLRVEPQSSDAQSPTTLIWPEYSGNNLYQTLGNIAHSPTIGLCIPNFVTGDVLYVSGTAEILIDRAASAVISKSRLAVRLTIVRARFVKEGLMFRGIPSESNRDSSSSNPVVTGREIRDGMSPYNPRVRYLVSEIEEKGRTAGVVGDVLPPDEYRGAANKSSETLTASLTRKVKLTPTITRYTFRLSSSDARALSGSDKVLWQPGQYVALDFSEELYMGYSHMRDDEPTSLNDDFIRTFTVATRYPDNDTKEVNFDIVVRNVGVVTRWLSRQNERSGMTNPRILGFAGEVKFVDDEAEKGDTTSETDTESPKTAFIAAGIGVTPLLAQLPRSLSSNTDFDAGKLHVHILWTLHIRDIGLAVDIVPRIPTSLYDTTRLFVTGTQNEAADSEDLKKLELLQREYADISIEKRRLAKDDVTRLDRGEEQKDEGGVTKWIVCTAPEMRKELQTWISGGTVEFENFDY